MKQNPSKIFLKLQFVLQLPRLRPAPDALKERAQDKKKESRQYQQRAPMHFKNLEGKKRVYLARGTERVKKKEISAGAIKKAIG